VASLTSGSTYRFELTATKDGEVWDLTGATVTLRLRDPAGAAHVYEATLSEPTDGVAYYDNATDELEDLGGWTRSWRVVQGAVDLTSLPISFTVVRAP
jgi:hypothetical protein